MPWIKVAKEHHPLFLAALPKDPRVSTMPMFGGICGVVNGNIFGGLFGRSIMARLDDAGLRDAARAGAEPFDPMGRARAPGDKAMMPEAVMHDPTALRRWLQRAFDYTATLPAKQKAKATANAAPRPAAKRASAAPRAAAKAKPKATARPAPRR